MINSKKGQEMYSSVSPIYERNEVMKAIFEAIGSESDMSVELADDILLQLFPQTATWGLAFWEQRLKLITNLNEGINIRRAKVLTKLQSRYIVNPQRMANMLQNFVSADIEIKEDVAPYVFEIDLLSQEGFQNDLKDLYATATRTKPSHLGIKYKLVAVTQSNLYIGSISIAGEIISTYPWTPSSIESKTDIYIPIVNHSNYETIVTYPKEE